MEKRIARIFCAVACACALVLGLAACGSSKDYAQDFVGYYQVDSFESEGDSVTGDDLRGFGMDILLVLDEDGEGEFNMFGEPMDVKWEATGEGEGSITIEGQHMGLTLADGILTIDEGDSGSVTFVPIDEDDYEAAVATLEESVAGAQQAIEDSGDVEPSTFDESSETEAVTIDQTIADDEYVTIVANSYYQDGWGDPGFEMTFTNNYDEQIYIIPKWYSFKVNGIEVDPTLYEFIDPGQTVTPFVWFEHADLGGGLDSLTDVHGTIEVHLAENDELLGEYEVDLL